MLVVITLRYIIVLFNSSFLWKWNDHGQRELLRKNEKGFHFENVSNIENDKNFGIAFFCGLIGKIYTEQWNGIKGRQKYAIIFRSIYLLV